MQSSHSLHCGTKSGRRAGGENLSGVCLAAVRARACHAPVTPQLVAPSVAAKLHHSQYSSAATCLGFCLSDNAVREATVILN